MISQQNLESWRGTKLEQRWSAGIWQGCYQAQGNRWERYAAVARMMRHAETPATALQNFGAGAFQAGVACGALAASMKHFGARARHEMHLVTKEGAYVAPDRNESIRREARKWGF